MTIGAALKWCINQILNNRASGVQVRSSSAVITNNSSEVNGSSGIRVTATGHAHIGFTLTGEAGPNEIVGNILDGIAVFNGANAFVFGNEIQGNGRNGIGVGRASAHLLGQNEIAENENGVGVFNGGDFLQAKGDFVVLPDSQDTIRNNRLDGILAFNGATLDIRNALITGNGRHGIRVGLHSSVIMNKSEI